MFKNRTAAKVDENQAQIVKELRRLGYSVRTGMDDLLVGRNGKTYWFEIKDPAKTLKKDGTFKAGAIKLDQLKLLDEWKGQYHIVTTTEQILRVIND